ncbi:hypothetical protein QOT17_019795 [Balamuthia mandrillaris]
MDWSDLTAEVLLDVFSRLNPFKDVAPVMLVCKAWNNLAQDRTLWRRWHEEHLGGVPCPADGWRESFVKTMLAVPTKCKATKFCFPNSVLVAAQRGHTILFRRLLRQNQSLLTDEFVAKTILCEAAMNGHHAFIQQVYFDGECPWSAVMIMKMLTLPGMLEHYDSPLAHAAKEGHDGVVRCLLNAATAAGVEGMYPARITSSCALEEAVKGAHSGAVRLLVPFYDLNTCNCTSTTSRRVAHRNTANVIKHAVQPLVEAAASSHTRESIKVRVLEVLNTLFEGGLVLCDRERTEALSYAADTNSNAVMRCLFSHGCSPDELDITNDVKMNDVEKVRFMLWHGASCEDATLRYHAKQYLFKEMLSLLRKPPRKEETEAQLKQKQTKGGGGEEEHEEAEDTKEKVENKKQVEAKPPLSKKQIRNQEKELEKELRETYPNMFEEVKGLDVLTLRRLLSKSVGDQKGSSSNQVGAAASSARCSLRTNSSAEVNKNAIIIYITHWLLFFSRFSFISPSLPRQRIQALLRLSMGVV